MSNSLKEQLLKLGLKSTPTPSATIKRNRPSQPVNTVKNESTSGIAKSSTFCQSCKKTLPDVEYYQHKISAIQGNWLCITCADRYQILDSNRLTNSSDFSKRGFFHREYGQTKKFFK